MRWGRRPTDARAKRPGRPSTGRKVAPGGEWRVCLRDRLPADITGARFAANRTQLEQNRQAALGVARRGASLLAGLVRCGRWGRRLAAQYSDGRPRYCCVAEASMYAGALCQSLTAGSVDRVVEALLLRALEPAAIEVSLAVAADLDAERARVELLWQQRWERAQYEVDRSRRQYNAVEPENRLAARTIERQLEAHLGAQLALQEDYHRYRAARPATLTDPERAAIRRLAADLPALWSAPSTTIEQRKAIVRQLVDEVGVTVEGVSERVALTVTWAGGHRTETTLVRPVAKLTQLSYYAALLARGRALVQEGGTHAQIAVTRNAEGWHPAKRRATFNASMVSALLESEVVRTSPRDPPHAVETQRGDHEWTLAALAHALGMPSITLHDWVHRGWVKGRKVASGNPAGRWLLWADAAELARLRVRRTARHTRWSRPARNPSTT